MIPGSVYSERFTETTIMCAVCERYETTHLGSKESALKLFRESGWTKTTKLGWVCDECRKEMGR